MSDVVLEVKTASESNSLEFGIFRLSIFTTYVTGLGLVLPGPHLHQIAIPSFGTAAAKHLLNPFPQGINDDMTTSSNVSHDLIMEQTSISIGCKYYHRTLIETLLCEGHPNRNLRKKDLFKKGQKLFYINNAGIPGSKVYGQYGQWIPVLPTIKSFRFIKNY